MCTGFAGARARTTASGTHRILCLRTSSRLVVGPRLCMCVSFDPTPLSSSSSVLSFRSVVRSRFGSRGRGQSCLLCCVRPWCDAQATAARSALFVIGVCGCGVFSSLNLNDRDLCAALPATPASDARQRRPPEPRQRRPPPPWPGSKAMGDAYDGHFRSFELTAVFTRPPRNTTALLPPPCGVLVLVERPLHGALRENRNEAPRVAPPKLRFLHFPFYAANHHPSRGGPARVGTTRSVVDLTGSFYFSFYLCIYPR